MKKRHKEEAFTIVELMVVLVLVGLLATGVSVAVFAQLKKGKVRQTGTDVQAIRSAAIISIAQGDSGNCPDVDALVQDGSLDKGVRTKDAWNHEFQINCEGNDVAVTSAGPDGEFGTDDDIH